MAREDDEPSTSSPSERVPPWRDFYSPHFDAARALAPDSGARPPRPKVRALDTVRQCKKLLTMCGLGVDGAAPGAVDRRTVVVRDAASFAAQAQAKARAEKFKAQDARFATRTRVVDALASTKNARDGPLSVIRDARERRVRVSIVTRHARGVRGTAEAYVEAFDKFMNLILTDVEETYSVRGTRDVERIETNSDGTTTTTFVRRVPKLEQRTRRIQQVFLRGEHVVSVSIPPEHVQPR
jgi:small nuclear ribonucleoprotein (snRNP)-like protein